jgi:hypothetical protein
MSTGTMDARDRFANAAFPFVHAALAPTDSVPRQVRCGETDAVADRLKADRA